MEKIPAIPTRSRLWERVKDEGASAAVRWVAARAYDRAGGSGRRALEVPVKIIRVGVQRNDFGSHFAHRRFQLSARRQRAARREVARLNLRADLVSVPPSFRHCVRALVFSSSPVPSLSALGRPMSLLEDCASAAAFDTPSRPRTRWCKLGELVRVRSGAMDELMRELAASHPAAKFVRVEAARGGRRSPSATT